MVISREKICIRIANWQEYAGTSRSPFYFRLPLRIASDMRWDLDNSTLGIMVRLLAIAGSSSGSPGVIRSDTVRMAAALHCHPGRVPKALRRLEDAKLIQLVADTDATYEEIPSYIEKIGHSSFPDWVFDHFDLPKVASTEENTFFSRDILARGILQLYPNPNHEAAPKVQKYLEKVIYNDRWLVFVQHCIVNYERRKRAKHDKPSFHNIDRWFTGTAWWEHSKKDNHAMPTTFQGPGTQGKVVNGGSNIRYHTRSYVDDSIDVSAESQPSENYIDKALPYPTGVINLSVARETISSLEQNLKMGAV